MEKKFETPILFIIFNRPETTQKVFNEIRKIKPKYLFVSADGPRPNKPEDVDKCSKTREIIKQIDWDCNIYRNFRDKNVGCREGVSSSIDWFFKNVEEGIILEDDCLPHPSFFTFCQELLEKYRHDERIFMISGNNFLNKELKPKTSYYFSGQAHIWGWASWRRSWRYFDLKIPDLFESIKTGLIKNQLKNKKAEEFFTEQLIDVYDGGNSWDYQWVYSLWKHKALSITPSVNLISNIGFGSEGTHSFDNNDNTANLPTEDIVFPLIHPEKIEKYQIADNYENNNLPFQKFYKKIAKKILRKIGLIKLVRKVLNKIK